VNAPLRSINTPKRFNQQLLVTNGRVDRLAHTDAGACFVPESPISHEHGLTAKC
jgi:hypothetical protein